MTNKSGRAIQLFISFLVFMISGIVIFNPIYNSTNIGLSIIISIITSLIIFEFYIYIFQNAKRKESVFLIKPLSIFTCIFAIICTIIYMTEIIKDISHIAGRGISLFYYTALSFAILAVSYYLCYNTEKGIFRFSILSLSSFIVFIIIIVFSFAATKQVFWHSKFPINTKAVTSGILTGLFLTIDIPIYLATFQKYVFDGDEKLYTKPIRFSFWSGILILCTLSILPFLIFGKHLSLSLSDPIYSATKLFPWADMTEAGSVVKIVGFMIKSSIYIYYSSSKISCAFKPKKTIKVIIILCLYASIPAIFLIISIFDKKLEYGAFQYMIYSSAGYLGIFSALSYLFSKNE